MRNGVTRNVGMTWRSVEGGDEKNGVPLCILVG